MKRLSKKIILLVAMLEFMFLPINTVKAALQSNPNTHIKKADYLPNWIKNMRNMERAGEAMGLNEKLNSDLTAESESNNIDVHMMKSTEYGAIAILSVSGYGNPQTLQTSEIKSTTGNKSGVYFNVANRTYLTGLTGTNWEYVAGGLSTAIPTGVNPIYYDEYDTNSNNTKIGDALGTATTINPGCRGWHSASSSGWVTTTFAYFGHTCGGLFSFDTNFSYGNAANNLNCARGIAVCGEGL